MGQLDKDQLAAGSVQLWSPHRALSGAKAPSFSLTRACTHAHTLTHIHTHAGKHTSVRVGLAEISLMTLGRENDASSSSHPEPLLSTLSQATLQVPVTSRPASELACGSLPSLLGRRQPGPKPQMWDKGLPGFWSSLYSLVVVLRV